MTQRIIIKNTDGSIGVVVPAPGFSAQDCISAVPVGLQYEIVDTSAVPADRTFRNAWKHDPTKKVDVDMPKAKLIMHDKRRVKRAAELAPLDIEATIPGKAAQAENARQVIRDKHSALQIEIDAAASAETLKTIITREGL